MCVHLTNVARVGNFVSDSTPGIGGKPHNDLIFEGFATFESIA